MKKYEYKVIDTPNLCKEKILNDIGKEGWELVNLTKEGLVYYYIFKREYSHIMM